MMDLEVTAMDWDDRDYEVAGKDVETEILAHAIDLRFVHGGREYFVSLRRSPTSYTWRGKWRVRDESGEIIADMYVRDGETMEGGAILFGTWVESGISYQWFVKLD